MVGFRFHGDLPGVEDRGEEGSITFDKNRVNVILLTDGHTYGDDKPVNLQDQLARENIGLRNGIGDE
jgi:hypothetical protein